MNLKTSYHNLALLSLWYLSLFLPSCFSQYECTEITAIWEREYCFQISTELEDLVLFCSKSTLSEQLQSCFMCLKWLSYKSVIVSFMFEWLLLLFSVIENSLQVRLQVFKWRFGNADCFFSQLISSWHCLYMYAFDKLE